VTGAARTDDGLGAGAPQAFRYAIFIALGGFVFGFDASVISGVVGYVTREFELTAIQQGLVVSAPTLAAVFASLTVGTLSDLFGRRLVLQALAACYTLSALLSALAWDYPTLVTARVIGGYAFGSLVLAPVYIAELAPARWRGRLVSVNQFNIVIGLSAAYFSNFFLQRWASSDMAWIRQFGLDSHTWNWMLGMEVLPALAWLLLLPRVPRSPRWLATQGRWAEAEASLRKVMRGNEVHQALEEIRASLGTARITLGTRLRELVSPKMSYILAVGVVLAVFQQITGINTVFFYATSIFEQSGVGTDAAFAQAVSVGLVNVVFTVLAISTIDSLGRKPLLIIGLAGVTVSMGVVAYGFHEASYVLAGSSLDAILTTTPQLNGLETLRGVVFDHDVAFKQAVADAVGSTFLRDHEAAILKSAMTADARLILIGILTFVAAFAMSLGPVMWVLLAEIFPTRVRGVAISLVTVFNSGASWLVQFAYPWEVARFGSAGVFATYSLCGLVGFLLALWLVPETKGQSLEELEERLVKARNR
jgi:sugar porter (SP) family MFS transporter